MVKIYIGNKPVFLVSGMDETLRQHIKKETVLFSDKLSNEAVAEMVWGLEKGKADSGVFLHADLTVLLDAFKSNFTLIQAAGGLVYTDSMEVLLIFRLGKWDLPKGKLDEGETLTDCAAREIEEETGVGKLQLQSSPLPITYHTYRYKGRHILKESHWFLFHTATAQPLTPQTEEDIEKCEWAGIDSLEAYLENTYPAVLDVIEKGVAVLRGQGV